jgi:hypothetical protein
MTTPDFWIENTENEEPRLTPAIFYKFLEFLKEEEPYLFDKKIQKDIAEIKKILGVQ